VLTLDEPAIVAEADRIARRLAPAFRATAGASAAAGLRISPRGKLSQERRSTTMRIATWNVNSPKARLEKVVWCSSARSRTCS
jgi:hypothetical protein